MKMSLLGDVCNVIMGQSPPSSTYNNKERGLPFFQGKVDFGDMFPAARIYCDKPTRIALSGDVLVSFGPRLVQLILRGRRVA